MADPCRRCGVSDVQSGFLRGWRGRVYPHADAWRLCVGDAVSRTCNLDFYAGGEVASTRMLTHGGSVSAMRCHGYAFARDSRVSVYPHADAWRLCVGDAVSRLRIRARFAGGEVDGDCPIC